MEMRALLTMMVNEKVVVADSDAVVVFESAFVTETDASDSSAG